MKTFNQFAEDAEKIKGLINNNKGLQKGHEIKRYILSKA